MLGHLMTSWHLNIWKAKIWLYQEQSEMRNEKHFSLFRTPLDLQIRRNVANATFTLSFSKYMLKIDWFLYEGNTGT